jgi:hypothetical protein
MRRMKIVGLCLMAVFAMSALVFSASASAVAPEYGSCVKKAKAEGSGYSNSGCTKAVGTGAKFEWTPGAAGQKFSTTGGVATLTTVKGEQVTCEKENSTGEYLAGNNKEEKTTVNFEGCKSGGLTCTTEGKKPGELTTNELIGIVGYEKEPEGTKARKTVLELHPGPSAPAHHFIDFKCTAALTIEVRGVGGTEDAGILVKIKNGKMTAVETLKYTQSKGKQKPEKWIPPSGSFPNPTFLESNFQGTGFAQSGQTITSKVENAGGVKLELNGFV